MAVRFRLNDGKLRRRARRTRHPRIDPLGQPLAAGGIRAQLGRLTPGRRRKLPRQQIRPPGAMQPQHHRLRQLPRRPCAAQLRHRARIGAPHPHPNHVIARPRHRPRIPIALRRPRLQRHRERKLRRPIAREARQPRHRVAQKPPHQPGRVGADQRLRIGRRPLQPDQIGVAAILGQRGIGAHQPIQAGRQRADRHRQAEPLRRPVHLVQPQPPQEREPLRQADPPQQVGRRHVPRIRQRLPRQQRPQKVMIGIADPGSAFRLVGHDILRRDQPALQPQRIQERLQRAAR